MNKTVSSYRLSTHVRCRPRLCGWETFISYLESRVACTFDCYVANHARLTRSFQVNRANWIRSSVRRQVRRQKWHPEQETIRHISSGYTAYCVFQCPSRTQNRRQFQHRAQSLHGARSGMNSKRRRCMVEDVALPAVA